MGCAPTAPPSPTTPRCSSTSPSAHPPRAHPTPTWSPWSSSSTCSPTPGNESRSSSRPPPIFGQEGACWWSPAHLMTSRPAPRRPTGPTTTTATGQASRSRPSSAASPKRRSNDSPAAPASAQQPRPSSNCDPSPPPANSSLPCPLDTPIQRHGSLRHRGGHGRPWPMPHDALREPTPKLSLRLPQRFEPGSVQAEAVRQRVQHLQDVRELLRVLGHQELIDLLCELLPQQHLELDRIGGMHNRALTSRAHDLRDLVPDELHPTHRSPCQPERGGKGLARREHHQHRIARSGPCGPETKNPAVLRTSPGDRHQASNDALLHCRLLLIRPLHGWAGTYRSTGGRRARTYLTEAPRATSLPKATMRNNGRQRPSTVHPGLPASLRRRRAQISACAPSPNGPGGRVRLPANAARGATRAPQRPSVRAVSTVA